MTNTAKVVVIALVIVLFGSVDMWAQKVGPPNGSLVVVGGGMKDLSILDRFLRLAGGADAPIVVIPTAGGREHYDQHWSDLQQFKASGATNSYGTAHDRSDCSRHRVLRPANSTRAWDLV